MRRESDVTEEKKNKGEVKIGLWCMELNEEKGGKKLICGDMV